MAMLPDHRALELALRRRFGISLTAQVQPSNDGPIVLLRPLDLEPPSGFSIETVIGWRHVHAQYQSDTYAKSLLDNMAVSGPDQRAQFRALAGLLVQKGGRLRISINGLRVDPASAEPWPREWNSLELLVERTPLLIDHDNAIVLQDLVEFWGGTVFGMVVALLLREEVEVTRDYDVLGYPEGALQRIEVNRYERNRINRSLCIARHGLRCRACDFDFAATYGELGRDFIHVHHLVPVSQLGPHYVVNPVEDLVPVCPNCHAMLHRHDPPLSPDELRELLRAIEESSGTGPAPPPSECSVPASEGEEPNSDGSGGLSSI